MKPPPKKSPYRVGRPSPTAPSQLSSLHIHPTNIVTVLLVAPLLIGGRTVRRVPGTCPHPRSRRPPRSDYRWRPGWPPGRSRGGRPPPRSLRWASRRRGGRAGDAPGPGNGQSPALNTFGILALILINKYQDIHTILINRRESICILRFL